MYLFGVLRNVICTAKDTLNGKDGGNSVKRKEALSQIYRSISRAFCNPRMAPKCIPS